MVSSENSLEHDEAQQLTWKHGFDECQECNVTTIRALFDWTKKYGDTWNWYETKTRGLPNCKTIHKQVPCSRVSITAIKDSKKIDPLPSIFPPPR